MQKQIYVRGDIEDHKNSIDHKLNEKGGNHFISRDFNIMIVLCSLPSFSSSSVPATAVRLWFYNTPLPFSLTDIALKAKRDYVSWMLK